MPALIEFRQVSRWFGQTRALADLDLQVEPGITVGLLGPNGAGKTTVLRILQGVLAPTAGSVQVFGLPPTHPSVRSRCGNTPQDSAVPEYLTVREALTFVAGHYPRPGNVKELLEEFALLEVAKRRVAQLSGGQRRRVAVAMAFAGSPSLVFLDEPTAGLDIVARQDILTVIKNRGEVGVSAVITSHYLEDIESLADFVVILQSGQLRYTGQLRDFLDSVHRTHITFTCQDPETARVLTGETDTFEWRDGTAVVATVDSDRFVTRLLSSSMQFEGLSVRPGNLSDAFLALTRTKDHPHE